MKARPILFNTDMVQAILAGRKTQTRRELNPQPELVTDSHDAGFRKYWTYKGTDVTGKKSDFIESCPFGQPGDLLYVREAWRPSASDVACTKEYKADGAHIEIDDTEIDASIWLSYRKPEEQYPDMVPPKWRPSIHQPRWASRLTLEITDVRVERLRDIDRGDCMAEGCPFPNMAVNDPIGWFSGLWDSIYNNWDANPWVWVVEFKVHHCNVDALLREREAA